MIIALLAASGLALAQGFSADVELLRPSWSQGSLPGVDTPLIEEAGTIRGGGYGWYVRDPLVLYENEEEAGAVVSQRTALNLGATFDVGRVAAARVVIPAALQWGTDIPDLARDGPVLGDISAGMRLQLGSKRSLSTGLRGDLVLPTSTRESWMGEAQPRGILGVLLMSQLGPFDVLGDLGLMVRPTVPTGAAFDLGSEVMPNIGVRYNLWPERVALHVTTLNRLGLERLLRGGAENSSEVLTGIQLNPTRDLQWDIALGKGLSDGYGTSEFRLVVGATWIRRPPPEEPPPAVRIVSVPDEGPEEVVLPEADPPEEEYVWEEEELARVEGERIVIRDPIQFEFNTERILPDSLPTLAYVAGLLEDNWQITHLLIEGHASDEGSHAYNYDLSIRRARAIWEELIRDGVHPDRMSYRGMGETVPRQAGEDEASLATNRRVEFKIIEQLSGAERPEAYREEVKLPWSGDEAEVVTPEAPPPEEDKPPERPPPDPDAPLDIDQFLDEDEATEVPLPSSDDTDGEGATSPSSPEEPQP